MIKITVSGICSVRKTTSHKMGALLKRLAGIPGQMAGKMVRKMHFSVIQRKFLKSDCLREVFGVEFARSEAPVGTKCWDASVAHPTIQLNMPGGPPRANFEFKSR